MDLDSGRFDRGRCAQSEVNRGGDFGGSPWQSLEPSQLSSRTWRTRLSAYDAACRVDSAASLRDRVSTAIYLGAVENPNEMVLRQRQDALTHLAKFDPPALFPIRLPSAARRALVLAAVTAVLFVYRSYYKPPIVALLQTTARSQFVQSILSPIAYAAEKDLQRAMSAS